MIRGTRGLRAARGEATPRLRQNGAALMAATAMLWLAVPTALAQPSYWVQDRDFARRPIPPELANKTKGEYTVVVAGDLLVQTPVSKIIDPRIVKIIRDADTAIGNMETTIVDEIATDGGLRGNWGPKAMAADIADLGFDLLNGANNHTGDLGVDGMNANIALLDEQGIGLSGVGKNLASARRPAVQQTAKGRASLVSANTISVMTGNGSPQIATNRFGNMGGRPGLAPLRLETWSTVSATQLAQLKQIRDDIVARRGEVEYAIPLPKDEPDRVQIFGLGNYIRAGKTGEYHYEFKPDDLNATLISVRNAKEFTDFNVFMTHIHQNSYAFQSFGFNHAINDFEKELAHKVIDNGSDIYAASGVHTIKGVELYKGGVIFYGLSSFIFHQVLPEMEPESYLAEKDDPFNPRMTAIEVGEYETERRNRPVSLVGLLAEVKYTDGKLSQVRIHPLDLGADLKRPWSRQGVPQTPTPAKAREILEHLQQLSAPLGTRISIENGVGVIRL